MKKTLIVLLLLLFTFYSCAESEKVNESTEKPKQEESNPSLSKEPTPENNETPEDIITNKDESVAETNKPATVDEIIDFANNLKIDTSMTAFSLENVLPEAQLPLTEDAGDEYQNSTAYLGDSVTMGLAF